MDVLANDTVNTGSPVTILFKIWGQNGEEFIPNVESIDGNWSVEADNTVTFTPRNGYGGGPVWIEYQISDTLGHISVAQIQIGYPREFYAEYDNVTPSDLSPQTVDVLANDIYPVGAQITVTVDEIYGPQGGTWSVSGEDVVFTPDNGFGGGSVYTQYVITDENGRTSSSQVSINYPKEFYAEQDNVTPSDLSPQTVDVLANDTVNTGSPVTILFKIWGQNGEEFIPNVESIDGNWSVEADNTVTFTPRNGYGGGPVWIEYQISDTLGHISVAQIQIDYPREFYAEYDQVNPLVIEETVVPVLNNDTVIDVAQTDVLLSYNGGYTTFVEVYDGNWSINIDKTVTFIPNRNVINNGSSVYIQYQISDQIMGYTSESSIYIQY